MYDIGMLPVWCIYLPMTSMTKIISIEEQRKPNFYESVGWYFNMHIRFVYRIIDKREVHFFDSQQIRHLSPPASDYIHPYIAALSTLTSH